MTLTLTVRRLLPSFIFDLQDPIWPPGGVAFLLSTRSVTGLMAPDVYRDVLDHFVIRLPFPVRSHIATSNVGVPLLPQATFFDYVVINQRRYWASSRNSNNANSLISVMTGQGSSHVGELTDIFTISQSTLGGIHRFGRVRWLQPFAFDMSRSAWSHSYARR